MRVALYLSFIVSFGCSFDPGAGTGMSDDPPPSGEKTVVFEDGLDGYTGTRDVFLDSSRPGANLGDARVFEWDFNSRAPEEPANADTFALLRFESVFDDAGGPIPRGAQIVGATLTLEVLDGGAPEPGTLHNCSIAWEEGSITFDAYGGMTSIMEVASTPVVASLPVSTGVHEIDVTASVQAWSDGADELGWLFVPDNHDGVDVASRESTDNQRPSLVVTFR